MPTFTLTEEPDQALCCAICLEPLKEPLELHPCRHTFCKDCALMLRTKACPECRTPFDKHEPANRVIRQLVDALKVKCDSCSWTGTREQSASHKTCLPDPAPAPAFAAPPAPPAAAPAPPAAAPARAKTPPRPRAEVEEEYYGGCTAAPLPPPMPEPSGPPPVGFGLAPRGAAPGATFGAPPPAARPAAAPAAAAPAAAAAAMYSTPTTPPWEEFGLSRRECDLIKYEAAIVGLTPETDAAGIDFATARRFARLMNYRSLDHEMLPLFTMAGASPHNGRVRIRDLYVWASRGGARRDPRVNYGLEEAQYARAHEIFNSVDTGKLGYLVHPTQLAHIGNFVTRRTLHQAECENALASMYKSTRVHVPSGYPVDGVLLDDVLKWFRTTDAEGWDVCEVPTVPGLPAQRTGSVVAPRGAFGLQPAGSTTSGPVMYLAPSTARR